MEGRHVLEELRAAVEGARRDELEVQVRPFGEDGVQTGLAVTTGKTSGLKVAGWPQRRVLLMWAAVIVVSALSSAAGFALLDPASGTTGALVQAFAAGALLAMLANTLLPEAYEVEGVLTGLLVVVGFAASLALSAV